MEFQTKVTFQRKNLNKTELNSEKKPLDKWVASFAEFRH